jgi:hypothetical protein
MHLRFLVAPAFIACLFFSACTPRPATEGRLPQEARYLFAWSADKEKANSDFLAVVDASPASPTYGQVVASVPVGQTGTNAHHTEIELHPGGLLFANGFAAGRTWIFDLRAPLSPRIAARFDDRGSFSHPHSFLRLAGGNILATFQYRSGDHNAPGGLVEMDDTGALVRASPPADNPVDPNVRPYSAAVLPGMDLVVTTSTDMHDAVKSRSVQLWRFSDLKLLHTFPVPDPPGGYGAEYTAEPRVLADGTVLVSTFTCGLFRLTGLGSSSPSARPVFQFPGQWCGVPLLIGRFWVQTLETAGKLVVLDVSDPVAPVQISSLDFESGAEPHWLAYDALSHRIVVTGSGTLSHRIVMVKLNPATGALSWDESFRESGSPQRGISFERTEWPHGKGGPAVPHGTVFSRH